MLGVPVFSLGVVLSFLSFLLPLCLLPLLSGAGAGAGAGTVTATANTGSGGGGGNNTASSGGNGGSGIVLIRYTKNQGFA